MPKTFLNEDLDSLCAECSFPLGSYKSPSGLCSYCENENKTSAILRNRKQQLNKGNRNDRPAKKAT